MNDNRLQIRAEMKSRVGVIKRRDVPEFTASEFHREELRYLKLLMHKHKDKAKTFADEIFLTGNTVKV